MELEDIGAELGRWARDEEENKKLENWFKEWGLEFI
jgi:hypothetical protein